ncbi:MAG: phytanoyl-CoA dioxygenase family protein [Myxococcota bacterium]
MSQPADPSLAEAIAEMEDQAFYCKPSVPVGQVSSELAPTIAKLGLERNCRELAELGYTVVEDAGTLEFIARLRERVLEQGHPYAFQLLDKDPLFAEAVLNPRLMAMAEFSVGAGFLLSQLASSVRGQGSPCIPMHADQAWVPTPFPEQNMFLTACWVCDEFTKEGGATLVIPGTTALRRSTAPTELLQSRSYRTPVP